jgi:nucleotide-binding universal stress UspA family protein
MEGLMVEIDRIVSPVDFSENSERSFDHALALARWFDAAITVLHVPVLPTPPFPPDGELPYLISLSAEQRAELRKRLEAFVAPARGSGVTIDVVVQEGNAAAEVLRQAEERSADLIVMGTHGRGGFERLMLGSVTEKVVRKAGCPVLTIPSGARRDTPQVQAGYKKILCATDFSGDSAVAVNYTLSLAQEANSTVIFLHVVQAYLDELASPGSSYHVTLEQDARRRLRANVSDEVRAWCDIEELIKIGTRPSRAILEVAKAREVGLIVMGAQGKHAFDRLFFGSTTHRVITHAEVPVLTLRPA